MPSFFTFSSFATISALRHAVTTRQLSPDSASDPFDALNLAFHVEDDPERVRANRRALAESLGFDVTQLSAAQQAHQTRAQIVTARTRGQGALDWESAHPNTDALITAESQTPVLILVADCAPLLLVDSHARVLAVVHAGWRGAVARIVSQTIEEMKSLGAQPERMQIGIGPHLCALKSAKKSRLLRRLSRPTLCCEVKRNLISI
jgi:YfiH family protein